MGTITGKFRKMEAFLGPLKGEKAARSSNVSFKDVAGRTVAKLLWVQGVS